MTLLNFQLPGQSMDSVSAAGVTMADPDKSNKVMYSLYNQTGLMAKVLGLFSAALNCLKSLRCLTIS